MAINYATKYHSKVAERFKKGSITNAAAGNEYSFVGAKTIVISSVDVVPMTDFDREAGSNRFGAVTNLGDTKQEMQMTKDRSFCFAIDAGDNSDQAIDKAAGKALRRQIDEVVNPELDKYRLGKWAEGGMTVMSGSTSALTKSTILAAIIKACGEMSNNLVPEGGRTVYIPIRNYQLLVQADAVVSISDAGMAADAVEKGVVGMINGCKVVPVPDTWFPEGVEFMVKHKGCTVDPVKLANYYIRRDAQGFDGPVVEGRIYYDSFVIEAKKAGIVSYKLGA